MKQNAPSLKLLSYILILLLLVLGCKKKTETTTSIKINGLKESVEVVRDEVGINHIYANNQQDLFFAQGYCAAKDRLYGDVKPQEQYPKFLEIRN